MANLFVLNIRGECAPAAADKNATRLIARAAELLGSAPAPAAEAPDEDELCAALFTRVASGEVTPSECATRLKAIKELVAEHKRSAKAEPPVLTLGGTPATAAEVKRAFRGAADATSVEVASLDQKSTAVITMFRV